MSEDATNGAALQQIADDWTRLADEYEDAARPPGPIAAATGYYRATVYTAAALAGCISDELHQATWYAAHRADQAGIDPAPLLAFVERPNLDALVAARTVVMRLSLRPDRPGDTDGTALGIDDKTGAEPLGLDADQAAKLLGISVAHFYAMKKDGRLGPEPHRMGDAVRWDRQELLAWWNAMCPPRQKWKYVRPASMAAKAHT